MQTRFGTRTIGCYLILLIPEIISIKSKITKEKNGENVPHLEITQVVLVHCNIVNNDYQQDSGVLYKCTPNKLFDYFQKTGEHPKSEAPK